ncbi:MAG: hypothetical protein N2Z21_05175, partial [Candidatus Sumerlaeaceae bacterium]|nr:hypothetical protein [Candidatus Sumerlaeaceae bacterium]
MGCLGDDDGLNFADWLIVVFLILIFEGVVCAGGLAPTHGLREFASPAKLWIEGRGWESRAGGTSAP